MNASILLRRSAFAAAALAGFAFAPLAAASGVFVAAGDINNDVEYVGRDGNWFNPSNWSSGRVPGAGDSVILDGDDRVVIDPQNDPTGYAKVTFGDLVVSSVAVMEVLPGVVVRARNQLVRDSGSLIFRASGDVGESLVVERDSSAVTLVQNPSPKTKRFVLLLPSVTMDMGLGGDMPASVTLDVAGGAQLEAGPGHYATMTVDTLVIDGDLKLSTYYGFEPWPGQSFQIVTVNGLRSGEFIGLPEGGYVGCTDDNVGLRLSYVGGDGNDLVISAEQTEPGICLLLPAVQKVREAAATARIDARIERLPIVDDVEETTQTREHILLARQVGVPMVEETASKLPSPTTPISGPKPTPK
jgi:hypothetical protein